MSRDTSFYYSFLVLPAAQRDAIVTVWDACRAIDDAVDEAASRTDAETRLRFWRGEIARVFDGGAPESSQGLALQPIAASFALPRRAFEDLVDGVQMDLEHTRYATFADLREYCWRVASTVGFICLNIFGCRHPGRPRLRDEPRAGAAADQHRPRRRHRPRRAAASTCRRTRWSVPAAARRS